ncbi:hypothetical protein RWK44_11740 [Rhizobium sp. 25PS6]|nr:MULTISPECIES: hypothetical protein [unclassified Rhizobium]MDU0309946.1 hypothetical protein [Rhizobium sp. 10PS4]MDU0361079.1 hypothetical protein [Rhizobium sp. 25PS6]
MVAIGPTICVADQARSLSNIMLIERRVAVGIVDKRTIMLVSIRRLHGCRKLSTILALIGRLARPFLSADGQPSGNQGIQQE